MTEPQPFLVAVALDLGATNEKLVEWMGFMKWVREHDPTANVVCCIDGFGDDPRHLWDIPEARAFCRRLVATGFISYLDYATQFGPAADELVRAGLGAAEVWLTAEGRMRSNFELTRELLAEIDAAVAAANVVADATLGPLVAKG